MEPVFLSPVFLSLEEVLEIHEHAMLPDLNRL
jgi:hypothetical protein